MERPLHLDARAASVSPSRVMFAVSLAVLLEAGAIYLVGSGLGAQMMRALPGPLTINIFEPPAKIVRLPPPPQARLVKPSLPMVSRPLIDLQTPPPPNQIAVNQSPHPVETLPVAATTPLPQTRNSLVPTPPHGIAATHTQPPYPMLARRIGKEGTVLLSITVGADGNVQNALIAKSSGDNDLDEAAVSWVKDHWKYRPASQSGQPVAAQVEAQVVFNLKQAQDGR